jgi:pilus assembly protein TadC
MSGCDCEEKEFEEVFEEHEKEQLFELEDILVGASLSAICGVGAIGSAYAAIKSFEYFPPFGYALALCYTVMAGILGYAVMYPAIRHKINKPKIIDISD